MFLIKWSLYDMSYHKLSLHTLIFCSLSATVLFIAVVTNAFNLELSAVASHVLIMVIMLPHMDFICNNHGWWWWWYWSSHHQVQLLTCLQQVILCLLSLRATWE